MYVFIWIMDVDGECVLYGVSTFVIALSLLYAYNFLFTACVYASNQIFAHYLITIIEIQWWVAMVMSAPQNTNH